MTDILLKISMSQSSIESISRFETKGLVAVSESWKC